MLKEEGIEPIKGFKKEGKLQSNVRNLRFSWQCLPQIGNEAVYVGPRLFFGWKQIPVRQFYIYLHVHEYVMVYGDK